MIKSRKTLFLRFTFVFLLFSALSLFSHNSSNISSDASSSFLQRKLLSSSNKPPWEQCAAEQTSPGVFLALYAFLIFHMFVGIAILCDDHFVPALETISSRLNLSEDVAGATFMAAGSSAPELFTSLAGVAVDSDVGVGTIFGSAVFNILVIVALSGLFAGQTLSLDWRIIARDAWFYGLSVLLFILFAWDGLFELYEAVVMLLVYIIYLLTLAYNKVIVDVVSSLFKRQVAPELKDVEAGVVVETQEGSGTRQVSIISKADTDPTRLSVFQYRGQGRMSSVFQGRSSLLSHASALGSSRASSFVVYQSQASVATAALASAHVAASDHSITTQDEAMTIDKAETFYEWLCFPCSLQCGPSRAAVQSSSVSMRMLQRSPAHVYFLFTLTPTSLKAAWSWLVYLCSLPYVWLFVKTVPDGKTRCASAFVVCVLWIAGLSFGMVMIVARCGCIMAIDDYVMGLVVVAAGTSIPDALSSILVAQDGYGDMAVSNAIGSNVFDIALGLGLPFMIKILIDGKPMDMLSAEARQLHDAGQLTITDHSKFGFALLIILGLTILAFFLSGFRLTRRVCAACLFGYVVFIAYALVQELVCAPGKC